MPITLMLQSTESTSLDCVFDYFSSIDMTNAERILEGAPLLRALANNRTFLAQRICVELKALDKLQQDNRYAAQVFYLGGGGGFFMRANFWPADGDSVVRSSGRRAFFYGRPHDHNFDFLTVGYFGPGYWSDFYEYDHASVVGYVGEPISMRYVGREALSVGKIMLYRASVDIHDQLPPDSFSISLNVMQDLPEKIATVNQYMMNLRTRTLEEVSNRTSLPLICEAASYVGDAECLDVISHLCRSHPHPRGRFAALEAYARLCPSDSDRVWRQGAADPSPFVHVQSRARLSDARPTGSPPARIASVQI